MSWLVYADVAQQTSVITLTRTVHRGQTIEADTLSTAAISRSAAVSSVPATEISRLVGQTALVDLLEGTVLPHGAIGVTTVPAPGRAIVGLQLAYGRVPSGLLPPSTPVRLVSLPANNAQTPDQPQREQSSPPVTFFGRVVDYTDGTDGASVLVNVDVAADEASRVTVLAATDRLAILRDAE